MNPAEEYFWLGVEAALEEGREKNATSIPRQDWLNDARLFQKNLAESNLLAHEVQASRGIVPSEVAGKVREATQKLRGLGKAPVVAGKFPGTDAGAGPRSPRARDVFRQAQGWKGDADKATGLLMADRYR